MVLSVVIADLGRGGSGHHVELLGRGVTVARV